MINYKVIIPLVIGIFVWQGVADAASISSRVRILESKISKQNFKIKQSMGINSLQSAKVDKSLVKIKALEKKVNRLLKSSKKAKIKAGRLDKRYAYP
ncbi:MAG: hypothetical protein ISEC1_P0059 [Thiomicrorhabdus sp.]|nr:MAG: hypothetical protein ISEC1_P0059 [Thiomicrorhabdus sp.]